MSSPAEPAPPEAPSQKTPTTWGERIKGVLRRLAMVAFSVLFAFLLGEGLVRLSGKHFEASLHTPDRELGWTFRPHAHGHTVLEGGTYITINSEGCNDREHAVEKPADTLRVAFIGDSYTGNYNTARELSYWSVFERKLGECKALGQRKIEVLPFGTGGYGTAQELLLLRRQVWKFRPDIIVLQFFGGNDILDNKREVAPFKANEPPYFLLRGDELVLDDSFKNKIPGPTALWMRNTFADVMNHFELALMIKLAAGAKERAKTHILDSRPKDLGLPDRLVFQPPTDPNMIEAWRVTEALVTQMAKEVREKGAEFRIMVVSSPQQVHPDVSERQAFMTELKIDTLFYVEDRMAKLAEKERFPLFSTSQPLAEYTAKNNVVVHGFKNAIPWGGHWNELGHRLAGEWLAADYCKRFEEAAKPAPAP